MTESTPGRRRAATATRRLPSPVTLLAVAIPLLTVAALALVRPAPNVEVDHPPTEDALAISSVVCPASTGTARQVVVGSATAGDGEVTVLTGGDAVPSNMAPALTLRQAESVVVTAEGELAPGLVGSRSGGGAATACTGPQPSQWFTGLGGGAEHHSVLTLTNPDRGPAVADITVLGEDGVMDVPDLLGVRVGGGESTTLDLAGVIPTRDALALEVVVSRGRLGVHVVDVIDPLGSSPVLREWVPGQATPSSSSYVLGLGAKGSERVLTLANPGDSEVRVEPRIVTGTSEFAPAEAEEVRVAPGAVTEVDLTELLASDVAEGALALRLDATGPITAGLRALSDDDLVVTTAGPALDHGALAVPVGPKRLLVAGASTPGVLTWTAHDARGREVGDSGRTEIDPGTITVVPLPRKAVLVDLELDRTTASMSIELGGGGVSVLALTPLELTSRVPDVRPAD